MITVTLGTIHYKFDRAISWLEDLLSKNIVSEEIFLQHGFTNPSPLNTHPLVTAKPTVPSEELMEMVKSSKLVIAHAGQGSTRGFAIPGVRLILLPRLAKYQEHIDNHQLLFAQEASNFGVHYCLTLESLKEKVLQPPPAFTTKIFSEPKLGDYLSDIYPPN